MLTYPTLIGHRIVEKTEAERLLIIERNKTESEKLEELTERVMALEIIAKNLMKRPTIAT